MLTLLLMLFKKVEAVNLTSIILASSWIVYLILFFVVHANRKASRIKTAFISGIIVTFVFDIIWFFSFFDNFDYINPGLKGILWIIALPAALLILVMVLSYININIESHEKRVLEKAAEKERKKESRRLKHEIKDESENKDD